MQKIQTFHLYSFNNFSDFIQSNIFFKEKSDVLSIDLFTFLEHNN